MTENVPSREPLDKPKGGDIVYAKLIVEQQLHGFSTIQGQCRHGKMPYLYCYLGYFPWD